MTISEALREIVDQFKRARIVKPELDAELILSYILNLERYRIITDSERKLSTREKILVKKFTKRRIRREPIAYIIGKKEFYSLEFIVNRDVLIPRPETELLVDLAILYSKKGDRVLDLGTGSGAISIALKKNRSDLQIFASDISEKALKIARINSRNILGSNSIEFAKGDLFQPFGGIKFDLIATNPPYLDSKHKGSLQKEIHFEPEIALFAKNNGGEILKRIIFEAEDYLYADGMILMELCPDMETNVREAVMGRDYSVSIMNDYSNLSRIAILQRENSIEK